MVKLNSKVIMLMLGILFISSKSLAIQQPTANYLVAFHNVKTTHHELSQEACNQMMKTFTFSKRGEQYYFNQQDNPRYNNHIVMAVLSIHQNEFLEVDNVNEKFTYANKTYNMISWLSSITHLNPFIVSDVLNNPYCKAAYVVLIDNPDLIENLSTQTNN